MIKPSLRFVSILLIVALMVSLYSMASADDPTVTSKPISVSNASWSEFMGVMNPEFTFRNGIKFGMNEENIKNLEIKNNMLIDPDTSYALVYRNVFFEAESIDLTIEYRFDENTKGLDEIWIWFTNGTVNNMPWDKAIETYNNINDFLVTEYGEPTASSKESTYLDIEESLITSGLQVEMIQNQAWREWLLDCGNYYVYCCLDTFTSLGVVIGRVIYRYIEKDGFPGITIVKTSYKEELSDDYLSHDEAMLTLMLGNKPSDKYPNFGLFDVDETLISNNVSPKNHTIMIWSMSDTNDYNAYYITKEYVSIWRFEDSIDELAAFLLFLKMYPDYMIDLTGFIIGTDNHVINVKSKEDAYLLYAELAEMLGLNE